MLIPRSAVVDVDQVEDEDTAEDHEQFHDVKISRVVTDGGTRNRRRG